MRDPLRYLERNSARNSCLSDVLENNFVIIIILTVCMTLFIIYLAPERCCLSRCRRVSAILPYPKFILFTHLQFHHTTTQFSGSLVLLCEV